ncbi:MAG: cob(I)yrinic acid a,c-diamide adenosyltransferase [Alistipes sp.]|nr:cob(I)yrinic acid a,c-diamide adenosyltransferase [Alistipes sp.]
MKVYTKTGDDGTTSLIGGERVSKYDERVEAYGSTDELTAFTALLCDELRGDASLAATVAELERLESRLMSVSALLAAGDGGSVPPLGEDEVSFLESRIDAMQSEVSPIVKFTIPGGRRELSLCHVCRTVCRRAERAALRADAEYGVDKTALVWLNRLSDYFYLLGRRLAEHYGVAERLWQP